MWSRLVLGNNSFVGPPTTRTSIRVDEYPMLEAAVPLGTDKLLVSTVLFDEGGRQRARLVRNHWAHRQTAFELARSPHRFVVRHRQPRHTVLDVTYRPRDETLVVTFADLFTPLGRRVLVDQDAGVVVSDPHTMRAVSALSGAAVEHRLDLLTLSLEGDELRVASGRA